MILLNECKITIEQFPNKESKIKDFETLIAEQNLLQFVYEDDGDLLRLLFVKKRLNELQAPCELLIQYMPYSRMDRKIEGDLFTLKYTCAFINSLHFDKVYVLEPHSSITMDLLEHSVAIYPALDWLPQLMEDLQFTENDRIVFPDKGAAARYKESGYENICVFDKTRNPQTGRIENMFLKEGTVPKGAKCIIVDDLCSSGGTFIWSGNILKEMSADTISLLITHCEPRVLTGQLLNSDSPISHVYCSPSMMQQKHAKITYLPLNIERYVQSSK